MNLVTALTPARRLAVSRSLAHDAVLFLGRCSDALAIELLTQASEVAARHIPSLIDIQRSYYEGITPWAAYRMGRAITPDQAPYLVSRGDVFARVTFRTYTWSVVQMVAKALNALEEGMDEP